MAATASTTSSGFKEKLLSGIIWRALNVLFSFAFNALLVSQLGANASGSFFYLLNNLFFAVLILGIGLESGISYYNARKEISASFLFTSSIVWSVVGALFFFIIIFFLPQDILSFNNNHASVTIYVLGSMLTTFLSAIYFTNHDSRTPNLVLTITNIILILLLPKMPWINGAINFDTYVFIYLCSPFFSALILMILLFREKITFSLQTLNLTIAKPLLLFSFHSFILNLLFNLLKRSDYWFVDKWCAAADAGNYFQASKIIQLLLLLPALASFSLYPLIVQSIQQNEDDATATGAEKKVMQLCGLYFFIALICGFGIVAFGYWVFPLLYGNTFSSLYFVTLYLLPGMIFFAATYPLTVYFSGKNQNKTTMLFLCIAIISLALCNIVLTPKYFIYGAAISSSVSNIVYFFLMLRKFLVQNKLSFSIKDFVMPLNINAIFKAIVKI